MTTVNVTAYQIYFQVNNYIQYENIQNQGRFSSTTAQIIELLQGSSAQLFN